jgi:hypothetical protein
MEIVSTSVLSNEQKITCDQTEVRHGELANNIYISGRIYIYLAGLPSALVGINLGSGLLGQVNLRWECDAEQVRICSFRDNSIGQIHQPDFFPPNFPMLAVKASRFSTASVLAVELINDTLLSTSR